MSKKSEQMFKEVKAWQNSGKNKKEYLKGKPFSEAKFNYWLRLYKDSQKGSSYEVKPKASFQEINLPIEKDQSPEKIIELTTSRGTHIVIYE